MLAFWNMFAFTSLFSERSPSTYLCTWTGDSKYFKMKQGRSYTRLFYLDSERFTVQIFDGDWESDNFQLIDGNFTLSSLNSIVIDRFVVKDSRGYEFSCLANGSLQYDKAINGSIDSRECNLSIKIRGNEYTMAEFIEPRYKYLLFFMILKLVEFFAVSRLSNLIHSSHSSYNFSQASIVLSALLDVFYLLWAAELVSKLQIRFLHNMIMSFLSLLLISGKYRIYTKINEFYRIPMRENRLFIIFMFLGGFYISIFNPLYYINVIISNLVFAHHIIKNLKGKSVGKYLIFYLILTQLLLTLYVTAYPYNFMVWKPDIVLSSIVVFVFFLQTIGLFLCGKRDNEIQEPFIDRNNAQRIARIVRNAACCPICLDRLSIEDAMITRCRHAFHQGCLMPWIRINPICPFCRHSLSELTLSVDTLVL